MGFDHSKQAEYQELRTRMSTIDCRPEGRFNSLASNEIGCGKRERGFFEIRFEYKKRLRGKMALSGRAPMLLGGPCPSMPWATIPHPGDCCPKALIGGHF